jgi:RNA polymerase sigma-70 factor, ECF subfamily
LSESLPPISAASPHAESDSQTQFVQHYLRRIFLLIYRVVGTVDEAQELTQETFIKALQHKKRLRKLNDKEAHWLSRIAARSAIDFLRKSKRFEFSESDSVSNSGAPSLHADVARTRERKLELDGALAALAPRERVALTLRDLEQMPVDLIAAEMNCSIPAVRSYIANARIKFQRYLEARRPS